MGGSKVRENSSANITRFGGWSREGGGVDGEDACMSSFFAEMTNTLEDLSAL